MHPREIDVLNGGRTLRILWQDDSVSRAEASRLRLECNCSECRSRSRGMSAGLSSGISIPLATEAAQTIEEVHLVSSSRILIVWQDGHNKSYYAFSTIRENFPPTPYQSTE